MKVNQIYHTSYCGSTLLISLLKNVTHCYSEPEWSNDLIFNLNSIDIDYHLRQYSNNTTIKFDSNLSFLSSKIEGKKVFLYRNLKNHLLKVFSKPCYREGSIQKDIIQHNLRVKHPKIPDLNFNSSGKKHVLLWMNSFLHAMDTNILKINSNDFFIDKKRTLNSVCDYFNIKYLKNQEYVNYHVKYARYNELDCELSNWNPLDEDIKIVDDNYGFIPDNLCLLDDEICSLLKWTKNNFKFIPQNFL